MTTPLTLTADEHAELIARRQLSHRDQRKLTALIAVFIAFTETPPAPPIGRPGPS